MRTKATEEWCEEVEKKLVERNITVRELAESINRSVVSVSAALYNREPSDHIRWAINKELGIEEVSK